MIKIHDTFYMTDDESIQFVYNDELLYIEEENHLIVLNKEDIEDLLWFIKNIVKRG